MRRIRPLYAATLASLSFVLAPALAAPALARTAPARHDCRARRAARVIGSSARTCSTDTHSARGSTQRTHPRPKPAAPRHAARTVTPKPAAKPAPTPSPAAARTEATPAPAPAATVAQVLATPCQDTEATPEAGNLLLIRGAVQCLVNRVRAEHGEAPLTPNPDLERAAEEHSQELVADDYFAHVSPSGETPVERIRLTGYIPGPSFGYVIGENLAWGTLDLSTPESIVQAWVASPGHLANILESHYEDTGIGVFPAVPPSLGGDEPGATYAQEFGVILG